MPQVISGGLKLFKRNERCWRPVIILAFKVSLDTPKKLVHNLFTVKLYDDIFHCSCCTWCYDYSSLKCSCVVVTMFTPVHCDWGQPLDAMVVMVVEFWIRHDPVFMRMWQIENPKSAWGKPLVLLSENYVYAAFKFKAVCVGK